MYDASLFGKNLRSMRRERRITQSELAELIHITPQNISKWENGLCFPDLSKLCLLADALGVTPNILLGVAERESSGVMIAIDGGGTKTEFCLFTKSGEVIETLTLGATNPNIVGLDTALCTLKSGIDSLLAREPLVEGIFAGVSGCGTPKNKRAVRSYLEKCYSEVKCEVEGDILNVIYSTEYFDDCIVAIMGTGSVVAVNGAAGFHRLGGWGYLFDDGFSGFGIGHDAVAAALAEEDGLGEKTLITKLLHDTLGGSVISNINALYSDNNERIASYSRIAFEAYKAGDKVALEIIKRRISNLLFTIKRARELYGGKHVVFAGGLCAERDIILEHLAGEPLELHFVELPPIYGAASYAVRRFCVPREDFLTNFKNTYKKEM